MRRRPLLAGLAAGVVAFPTPALLRAERPLRLGLTPVLMISDLDLLDALRRYLSAASGHPVEIVTRRTYQEITALTVSGQVDAAWICGYPFVRYRAALRLLAVPLWRGRPLYQSYLIVSADRPVVSWQDLEGDVHAFSDPDSNSGYLVTAALLAEAGRSPEDFFAQHFFTYGHRNVVRAVAAGLASSGSVDGYVWEVMAELEPDLTAATLVVRASAWLGFPPIACARHLADTGPSRALGAAILGMDQDRDGRAVLDLLRLDGFGPAEPSLYDPIAALARRLGRTG